MVERNRRNNLTANFSVTKNQCMQRSVLRLAVGICIQLKMPFFVEVGGLEKMMTWPGSGLGWNSGQDYRIEGKFWPGWRDWRTLLGTLSSCFKTVHTVGKSNAAASKYLLMKFWICHVCFHSRKIQVNFRIEFDWFWKPQRQNPLWTNWLLIG